MIQQITIHYTTTQEDQETLNYITKFTQLIYLPPQSIDNNNIHN